MRTRAVLMGRTVALIAIIALAGCSGGALVTSSPSSSSSSAATATPASLPAGDIVVGAAIAMNGYLQPYDYVIAAVKVLIDQLNQSGGIDGHHIKLVQADTRSDPQQATIAVQQVIDQGAQVLLLTCESDSAAAEATVAQAHGLVNFTLCANEPGFGPPITGRLSFTANSSLLSEVSSEATFFWGKGLRSPFLFRDTSITYGRAACDGFKQSWSQLGGTIAGEADFQNGDASVAVQIAKMKKTSADSVVMCSYPPGGASAIRQLRSAGVAVPIIGPSAFEGKFWLNAVPNLKDFFVTQNASGYDERNPQIQQLFAQLKAAGVDLDVSGLALAAWSGAQAIFDAIKATKSTDGNVLADELEKWRDHPLAIGPTTYTADNHFPNRGWQIYELVGGTPKWVQEVPLGFVPTYTPGS